MKKEHNIYEDDPDFDNLDIENLLKPRCDFHVSPGFKQMLMEEAKAMPRCRRRPWIPLIAGAAAAAVAVLVILSALHSNEKSTPYDTPVIAASVERPNQTPTDTLTVNTLSKLVAEVPHTNQKNSPIRKSSSKKRQKSKEAITSESFNRVETEINRPQPVTEGEIPMISSEKSLDPDEVRIRMHESRRNAELAYIDRIRAEIEANDAYISQLMTSDNTLNSNTQIETPF